MQEEGLIKKKKKSQAASQVICNTTFTGGKKAFMAVFMVLLCGLPVGPPAPVISWLATGPNTNALQKSFPPGMHQDVGGVPRCLQLP